MISPATEEQVGTIPAATSEDVEKAVAAAVRCVESNTWTRATGAERARNLRAIASKVSGLGGVGLGLDWLGRGEWRVRCTSQAVHVRRCTQARDVIIFGGHGWNGGLPVASPDMAVGTAVSRRLL